MSASGVGIAAHADEVRRVLHVGRLLVPRIGEPALDADLAPERVALEHVGVFPREHLLVDGLARERGDLAVRRPDVLEEDLLALLVDAERLLGDVGIHRARERIGDHQRRRRQIVGAHVGIDAAFEVAVAGEHRRRHQILVVDGLGDFRRQRPGIADAGGAAEADQIVAELVEVLLQAGLVEILGHHLRAGRQRGLHPRLHREALRHRLAGEQAGADHHARVRGVGARRDRGDHHVAVAEIVVAAFDRVTAAARAGLGEILVERRRGDRRMQREHVLAAAVGALVELLLHRHGEARLHVLERDAILRALRSRERRLDLRQLELEHVGEDRIGRRLGAVHALRLGIGGDQRDALGRAAGVAQIGDGLVVDREEAAGGAVFRRHVAERGAIRDRHAGEAGAEELDELADHAALAQHLRDGEHEVGGGDAFLELAGELHADHFRAAASNRAGRASRLPPRCRRRPSRAPRGR